MLMTSIDITSNQREHGKIHGSHHGSKSCEICSLVASIKWLQSLTQWYFMHSPPHRRSLSSEPLIITIRKGTVFQQKSWTHRCGAKIGWYGLLILLIWAGSEEMRYLALPDAHCTSEVGLADRAGLHGGIAAREQYHQRNVMDPDTSKCLRYVHLNDFDLSMWPSYQFEGI